MVLMTRTSILQDATFPCERDLVISVCTKYVFNSPFPFTFIIPLQVLMYPSVCRTLFVSSVTCNNTVTQQALITEQSRIFFQSVMRTHVLSNYKGFAIMLIRPLWVSSEV